MLTLLSVDFQSDMKSLSLYRATWNDMADISNVILICEIHIRNSMTFISDYIDMY